MAENEEKTIFEQELNSIINNTKCPSCGKSPFENWQRLPSKEEYQAYFEKLKKELICSFCGYDYRTQFQNDSGLYKKQCPNCGETVYDYVEKGSDGKTNIQKIKYCPKCFFNFETNKLEYQKSAVRCTECGEILWDPKDNQPTPPEFVKNYINTLNKCPHCGGFIVKTEVTENETDKKCPNCGATVTFDPSLGKMHCDYCGYECDLPKPDDGKDVAEIDFESAVNTQSCEWGTEKKSVECKNCGAVTIYDALETAAVCPFCGSTQVMPAATDRTIAPGGVCPFTVTKETAGESFTKWLKRKWFTPKKAKKSANPDSFQGVYLPYWTYDAQTTSTFSGRAGYDHDVKQKDGSTKTETTWRRVDGVYQEFIDDETVMASKRHENSGVKQCEPFKLNKLIPYNPQVLAGFAAERYSIGLKEGWNMAQTSIQSKLRSNIDSYIKHHWSCDRTSNVKFSTIYSNITYKYILVPVWMSSFKYKEKTYQFVVNGQTGKVGGKAPVSALRVIIAVILGAALIAGLYFLLQ